MSYEYNRGYEAAKRVIAHDVENGDYINRRVAAAHHAAVGRSSLDQDEWTQGWVAYCEEAAEIL
jgi:hypothetical protein